MPRMGFITLAKMSAMKSKIDGVLVAQYILYDGGYWDSTRQRRIRQDPLGVRFAYMGREWIDIDIALLNKHKFPIQQKPHIHLYEFNNGVMATPEEFKANTLIRNASKDPNILKFLAHVKQYVEKYGEYDNDFMLRLF